MFNRMRRLLLFAVFLFLVRPVAGQAILVLPFENASGNSQLDWMSLGLAELGIERLAGEGRAVFPREEFLAAVEKLGLPASTHLTRATMFRLARETDADYVVFGEFSAAGRQITLKARVLRAEPPALSTEFVQTGAVDDLMHLHAAMSWQALRYMDPVFPLAQNVFVAQARSLRLDAFEQYVRGSQAASGEQRVRALREAARMEPAWAEPSFALAQEFLARGDCPTALIWLSRIPPAHARGTAAAFQAGVCHLQRNDAPRAEAALVSVSSSISAPEVWNNLAVARARMGRLDSAADLLRRAVGRDPEDTDYRFNLGVTALQAAGAGGSETLTPAVRALREVLRRRPDDAQARAWLVQALERSGRSADAAAERAAGPLAEAGVFPAVLRVKPKIEAAGRLILAGLRPNRAATPAGGAPREQTVLDLLTRGRQALGGGQLDVAERAFSESVLLAPDDGVAYAEGQLGLAEVHRRRGNLEQAVRAVRLSLWSREDAAARIILARLYVELKRPAEARSELRAVLRGEATPQQQEEARRLLDSLGSTTGEGARP